MKTKPRKRILWDDLRVSVYGPRSLQHNKSVCRCVEDLMSTFALVIKQSLKDCAEESPVLNRFRVKVER
jgi:hypothetical protein